MVGLVRIGVLAGLVGLAGCVGIPVQTEQAPFVAVPGPNKTEAQFQQDDGVCRAAAAQSPGAVSPGARTAAGPAGQAVAPVVADAQQVPPGALYLQCMAVRNNTVQQLAAAAPPIVYSYLPAYPVYGWGYGYPGFGYGYGYPGFYGAYAGFGFYGGGYRGYGYGGYRGFGYGGGYGGFHGGYAGGFGGGYHGGFGHR